LLRCEGCDLTGPVADALVAVRSLGALAILQLANNNFSGTWDMGAYSFSFVLEAKTYCELGFVVGGLDRPALARLLNLDLSRNQLSGVLASSPPPNLKSLDISGNSKLTGPVPDAWFGLQTLAATGTGLGATAAGNFSYPSFFALDVTQRRSDAEGHFSCPTPVTTGGQQFALPPAYDALSHCVCDSGREGQGGVCALCPAGTFSSSATVFAAVTNAQPAPPLRCSPCGPGTWSTAGLGACIACGAPNYVPANRSACLPPTLCGDGLEFQPPSEGGGGGGGCVPCRPGFSRSALSPDWRCAACVGNGHATRYGMSACQDCSGLPGIACTKGLLTVLPSYWALLQPSGFVTPLLCSEARCPVCLCL
jgi:hypothetical protein